MQTSPATSRKVPLLPAVFGTVVVVALVGAFVYLSRPAPKAPDGPATSEAKAYLPNLELKDVTMKATENFMRQQVIEVEGSISNRGSRLLQSIQVYCLFYAVDGRELYREKVPLLATKAKPLNPGESRSFHLPFDSVPNGWNQALPKMVVAQIDFVR